MSTPLPKLQSVSMDTPLRLAVAAKIAFPDGSISESGLRRERDRGHLATERIAGKEYTTLADIRAMRKRCRAEAKVPVSTNGLPDQKSGEPQHGSSARPDAPTAARDA